ncbi:MAG: PilW family protein [Nitrosomonadales bacterium]|nr:PilW family protein [Nitrosomonadales bacterium]
MKQSIEQSTFIQPPQRGFSLIELMISITIGLLILVTLSTLFINQSKARTELDKSNRMIDNGRYAMELLSSNLRMAGYYDTFVPRGAPSLITALATPPDPTDPCDLTFLTNSAYNLDLLRLHIQGVNATTTSTPAFSTKCAAVAALAIAAGNDATPNPGSDILVIRRASTATVAAAVAGDDTTYLQVSNCPAELTNNNLYMIATTQPSSFTLKTKNCATSSATAPLRAMLVQVYFVSKENKVGDGIPTLKRIEQDPTGASSNFVVTPLVEGIEYIQMDYGIDGDSNGDGVSDLAVFDGVADSYSSTCTACTTNTLWTNYWSNVVSVKINLLARNQQSTKGWTENKTYSLGLAGTVAKNDNFKRHAYTQLVRLNNPAGRREAPCTAPCR